MQDQSAEAQTQP